jgi:hypothetical protein
MKPSQDPERMRKLLARRERHGWTWPELSRRSGLPVWKLHAWRRRLARHKPAGGKPRPFVPVQVVDRGFRQAALPLEVVTPSGLRILIAADFDAEHLCRLLRTLAPGC